MGRFDEALAEIEKARELDPLSLAINTGVGHVLYLSGQYDKAIEEYKRAVELDPSFMVTHVWFGRPYLEKGMFTEAIAELETAVRLSGESTIALAMLGHGLASAGRKDEAMQILEKLKEKSKSQYVPSYWIAVIYNGFRDKEQVIAWMRKAFEERSSWLVWSNVEPRFAWLRDDPDFASLMSAMKFPGNHSLSIRPHWITVEICNIKNHISTKLAGNILLAAFGLLADLSRPRVVAGHPSRHRLGRTDPGCAVESRNAGNHCPPCDSAIYRHYRCQHRLCSGWQIIPSREPRRMVDLCLPDIEHSGKS